MAEQLGPGEARVWYARPERFAAPDRVAALERLLDPEERARHARFRFPQDRHLYLVAHGLLRTSLGELLGADPTSLRFQAGLNGKPELAWPPGAPLQFNLSHTTGLCAWIVARHCPVGVDVEDRRRARDTDAVAQRFFAPAEVAELQTRSGDDRRDRFLAYWTLKEAYLKARGAGLSLSLQSFAMRIGPTGSASVAFDGIADDPAAWQLATLRFGDDHPGAVAIQTRRPLDLTVLEV